MMAFMPVLSTDAVQLGLIITQATIRPRVSSLVNLIIVYHYNQSTNHTLYSYNWLNCSEPHRSVGMQPIAVASPRTGQIPKHLTHTRAGQLWEHVEVIHSWNLYLHTPQVGIYPKFALFRHQAACITTLASYSQCEFAHSCANEGTFYAIHTHYIHHNAHLTSRTGHYNVVQWSVTCNYNPLMLLMHAVD